MVKHLDDHYMNPTVVTTNKTGGRLCFRCRHYKKTREITTPRWTDTKQKKTHKIEHIFGQRHAGKEQNGIQMFKLTQNRTKQDLTRKTQEQHGNQEFYGTEN